MPECPSYRIFVVSIMQFAKNITCSTYYAVQVYGYTISLFPLILNAIWKIAKRLRGSRSTTVTDRNPDRYRVCIENCSIFCPHWWVTKFGWLADAFTMDEFEGAMDQCNNSAPGLDGIKFIVFKFLPEEAKLYLLGIFNEIMSTGMIPESLLRTKVVPILKPRKDPKLSDSYKPIRA
jgi:hypothetical protein